MLIYNPLRLFTNPKNTRSSYTLWAMKFRTHRARLTLEQVLTMQENFLANTLVYHAEKCDEKCIYPTANSNRAQRIFANTRNTLSLEISHHNVGWNIIPVLRPAYNARRKGGIQSLHATKKLTFS